jgi:glycerol-3-phosphate cytidylyltransferase
MIVMTFGTYDILHYGHVRILKRARELGDKLIVGVSSDELNFSKKGRYPVYSQKERMAIISSIRYVDEVFLEESLELKRQYLLEHKGDVLVMGDDWAGRFDEFSDICKVVYLPRTPSISTTSVIETVKSIPDL